MSSSVRPAHGLLAALLLVASFAAPAAAQDPAPTIVPPVPRGDEVIAEGRALPSRAAVLGVETPGVVTAIAPLGASVEAGAPLIVLDATAERARRDEAAAGRDAAAAAKVRAEAAATQAVAGVDIAVAALDRVTADLAAARAAVDRGQAALDEAEAARDALPDTASSALERQAKAVVQGAQAGLDQARAARDAAEAARTQAEAEVVRAEAARAAADAAVDVATAELARAEAGVAVAEATLARRTVIAPFAGTVAASSLAVGEIASPGLPIVRLADPSAWVFETTDLGTAGAARLTAGDAATITVDDVDGAVVPGIVRTIAVYGDERQGDITFRVIVDPTGPVPAAVRWNTIVTVSIVPGTGSAAAGTADPAASAAP